MQELSLDALAEQLPKPAYNYKYVMGVREKLLKAMASFNGPLTGDTFTSFVGQVKMQLPATVTLATVASSLSNYVGNSLTYKDRSTIARRLAGNTADLLLQRPVLSWCSPRKPEWVLAEVVDVRVVKRGREAVNKLVFDAVTGSCAGYMLTAIWSFKKFNYLAVMRDDKTGHGFGLTRPRLNKQGDDRSNYTYKDFRQLLNLHCYLLLDPKRSQEYPAFHTVGHNSGTTNHNRNLLKRRSRAANPCLLDPKVTYDCYMCPLGRDKCPLAVREKSCYKGSCKLCGKSALVDPSDPQYPRICVICAKKARCR